VIPRAATLAVVEHEYAGARAWAERHKVSLSWATDSLEIRATLAQPETNETFYLRGVVDGYRALAPAWSFTDATWTSAPTPSLFPRPGAGPFGAPIFIMSHGPVICVPFNRLAYGSHAGPHNDWGPPENWVTAGQQYVTAHYLGDMLGVIYRDFRYSRGRMG
jgi:hypothetical protein